MLCDHQLINTHLFDYIDEKLSPAVKKQVEQAINNCQHCQETYHQALQLHQSSYQWVDQPVPNWHRTRYAIKPQQRAFNWLSWGALATSTAAILMVIFQVQINTSDKGINIAFGNQINSQVESLVEKKMLEYKKQQALLLDARFVAESDKQATANQLMMVKLVEKTRNERRDDLNFLITGIQTQRFEDQAKVEKRINYLAENQIENNQYINQLVQSAKLKKGDNQ